MNQEVIDQLLVLNKEKFILTEELKRLQAMRGTIYDSDKKRDISKCHNIEFIAATKTPVALHAFNNTELIVQIVDLTIEHLTKRLTNVSYLLDLAGTVVLKELGDKLNAT